jgi:ATP-dependent Clp protease ATP-binding subunit ClpA
MSSGAKSELLRLQSEARAVYHQSMEFLQWHYGKGIDFYIKRWAFTLKYITHYFSLPLLLATLFSPWKRLVSEDTSPGFNFSKYFENLTFDLISRGIGAVVRITLFLAGLILLVIVLFGGAFGIVAWMVLPFLGISAYQRLQRSPLVYTQKLMDEYRSGSDPFDAFFGSEAGEFFVAHLGISREDFKEITIFPSTRLSNFAPKSFQELIEKLIKMKVWGENLLRKKSLEAADLILTAHWWDELRLKESRLEEGDDYGRPGIGLDLLFGYIPILSQYSSDLTSARSYSHRLIGRDDVVARMERVLSGGTSIILVGQPGVGKKTVVLEFAQKAITGHLGEKLSYKRVLEFDYNSLLSGSGDLNTKKTLLSHIFREASAAGNIILMIRDIQRLTNAEVEGYDFTDVFEEFLEGRNLKIIVVATPLEYERFISPNMRLRKYFETVEVTPPSKELAMDIMVEIAKKWETTSEITITTPSLRKILDESDRYITETPFPEKALELLDAVVNYCQQKGERIVTVDDVNIVLAEKTGVSFAALTETDKKRLGKLEDIIHERLVDQETAVSMIGKALRGRSVGVTKSDRPVGSFLFMGPTGVGKTETAKVLARTYYGSEDQILRFDMAEYAGAEGMERLIGSVSKNIPGALTTAIKNRPASLLLLDEIEKASEEIYNLFLALLDEGMITDAFGRKINARHIFVIATSNAGAEYVREQISKGVRGDDLQKGVVNYVLEKGIFTPEFLNRFDGTIVYEPLENEDLVKVATLLLTDLAKNLKKKEINLVVSREAATKLAKDGYDPAFGARPMRRIVDLYLGDLIGRAMLSGEIIAGDTIKIVPGAKEKEYSWEKVG